MNKEGLAIILSAPSGTGKTTVCLSLKQRDPDLQFSISYTTRPPRDQERDGADYHFISDDVFQKMLDEKAFLEWAEIHGNRYGTSVEKLEEVRKNGKNVVIELDVCGVETLRSLRFSGIYIFILPPSMKELEARLTQRATESKDQIQARLKVGRTEITKIQSYDYVITNHEVKDTVDTILSILKAEQSKRGLYVPECPEIKKILNLE